MFQWINDHSYTCPLLMVLQGWLKRQKWSYGSEGWVLLQSPRAQATSMWPVSIIRLECKLRHWCGDDQMEYRLRNLNA